MSFYLRLSYNSKGWQKPSGFEGKSINKGNHENLYGFGFEEWFFSKKRFLNIQGELCHFAYLDPLRYFDSINDTKQDLVLYTIQHTNNGSDRYIVLKLKKDEWKFIDYKEYLNLKDINSVEITALKNDLVEIMPVLRSNAILNRFEQQVNCIDWNGNHSEDHRLWNIQILKKDIEPIMELINELTECPDKHIQNLQMFRLYDSNNFNHQNCF